MIGTKQVASHHNIPHTPNLIVVLFLFPYILFYILSLLQILIFTLYVIINSMPNTESGWVGGGGGGALSIEVLKHHSFQYTSLKLRKL